MDVDLSRRMAREVAELLAVLRAHPQVSGDARGEGRIGVPIRPPPALDVLDGIERHESNPYVIVGREPCSHLVNLRKPWGRIRKKAGVDDVRLHDLLRHAFASVSAHMGLSLPMIGKMLGHNHAATTQRYAHLAADPVKEVVSQVGARLLRRCREKRMRSNAHGAQ
jgi:integrase